MGKNSIHLGEMLKKLREERRLTQEELSFKTNLHRTYIGAIERSEKNITIKTLYKIAKALDVAPSKLLPNHQLPFDESDENDDSDLI